MAFAAIVAASRVVTPCRARFRATDRRCLPTLSRHRASSRLLSSEQTHKTSGQSVVFPGPAGNIWNNSSPDPGALYNPNGQLVTYFNADLALGLVVVSVTV